jgi:long-chain acyl-CoA synthetase
MPATIEEWAQRRPDLLAIVSDLGRRTYRDIDLHANRLVRALRARGLGAGDSAALMCTNRPEFVEVMVACERAGIRLTPVNWHLTAHEAAYIVSDCEAKVLVADVRLADLALNTRLAAPQATVGLCIGGPIEGFESYDAALASEDDSPVEAAPLAGRMLYTSGTTGRPKGVLRPPAPTGASPLANFANYAPEGGDVHLCTGPLYHAAPLAFSLAIPLAFGATVVLMDKWDAEETLRLIEHHHVTHSHMVPTMFHRLVSLPEAVRQKFDTSTIRHLVHGAAPCPVPVKHKVIDWFGPVVWEYYAATEGTGSLVDSQTWLTRPGTVGKPVVEGQVIIADDDGTPVPLGEVGLVFLRAPASQRFEYYKDPDKTASAFRGEYFTLGDVGYFDEDGFLYLTDRSANLIISGGVNIYPAEIDAVLLEHPDVGDAATIGVPNEEWGEEVLAVIELREGVTDTDRVTRELLALCQERLARYKWPRRVEYVATLPRQDNGKIYKRLLRDQFRAAEGTTTAQV